MNHPEKEIKSFIELHEILENGKVCRIAMNDGLVPYIVPLCYGFADGNLYFHCARQGKKIALLEKNPLVCFEIDIDNEILESERAAKWTMKYRSIIGYGEITIIDSFDEKTKAYQILMGQFSGKTGWEFPKNCIDSSLILKLEIQSMTGKKSGF